MSATATPNLRTEPQDQRVTDAAERLARRLMDGGLVAEGADAWVTVLAMRPIDLDVAVSAAAALREAGRFEESLAVVDRVLRRRPGHVPAAACRASTLFAMERWREAFEAFEIRFKMMADPPAVTQTLADGRVVPRPAWSGGPVPKHVLVLAEQGMGDTIQFVRFLPRLLAAGAEITFVVEERLHALIRSMELPVTLRDRGTPGSVEGVKGWVPLMSLPRALGIEDPADLAIDAPMFRPDPARVARWRERIGDGGRPIGLVWQGNPDPGIDRGRSVPLEAFAPLAAIDGVRLISLQKGFGTEQIDGCAFRDRIETLGDAFDAGADGFLDSLAVLEGLDGVVSSCTSLAHLAASQLKPTTLLLKAQGADWRWLQARTDTVWYPTVTLARQPKPGDWAAAIATIADRLRGAQGVVEIATPEVPAPAPAVGVDGPLVPISIGELLDKLSILAIKAERIEDEAKRANVIRERDALAAVRARAVAETDGLAALEAELRSVNETLWDVEDALRDLEARQDFGEAFVTLARAVYHTNDRRAAIKKEINRLTGSALVEEKSYAGAA